MGYATSRKLIIFAVLLLLVLTSFGCSNEGNKGQKTDTSQGATVDPELVAIGERTVKSSCLPCHGRDLKGDMGPNLHNLALSDEQIMTVLIKGRGSMPPVTAGGKEEAVIAYLRTLK